MKFYLRRQFIHILTTFTTTPACCKLPFGRKINIPDIIHFKRICLQRTKVLKNTGCLLWLFLFHFYAAGQSQQVYYQKKLDTYFSKDHHIKNLVSINQKGIFISGDTGIFVTWEEVKILAPVISTISEPDLKKLVIDKKDSLQYFIQKDSLLRRNTPHSLKDIKIAIDPGHIGGTYQMAQIESRCMTLALDSTRKIQLIEGNLTFFTAVLLKHLLDSMGAKTMLTRPDTGISALGITFAQWKKKIKNKDYIDSLIHNHLLPGKDIHLLNAHLPDKVLFSGVFSSVDMAARAQKINAFRPDITVIIHYNVNEKNTGWKHTTDKDYVMAFVPGCITAENLKSLSGKLNFLRLLLSPDIEESVKLSSDVAKNISATLHVPLAQKTDATYLTEHCLPTNTEGVYARDLALTRLIRGPLVYGEPLYQDNALECLLLTAKNDTTSGYVFSERIKQVAQAYYMGINEYLQDNRLKKDK